MLEQRGKYIHPRQARRQVAHIVPDTYNCGGQRSLTETSTALPGVSTT
jgi:hypothetical protein